MSDFLIGKRLVTPSDLELVDEYALSLPLHQLAYDRRQKFSFWISMDSLQRLIFFNDSKEVSPMATYVIHYKTDHGPIPYCAYVDQRPHGMYLCYWSRESFEAAKRGLLALLNRPRIVVPQDEEVEGLP